MLQSVRISVGRTWRLVTDAGTSVSVDKTGYRESINALKNGESRTYELPWPPYRSRLWTYMYNGNYQNTASGALVATLLPLTHRATLADPSSPLGGPVALEVLHHPFAVTAIAHIPVLGDEPWSPGENGAARLQTLFQAPLSADSQVRDGISLDMVPDLPAVDADQKPAHFEEAGTFLLLSGLHHHSTEPGKLASALANLMEDATSDGSVPLKTDQSALMVSSGRVALVLPASQFRAGDRARCLHDNVATLLAQLQNLSTLLGATPTTAAGWFRRRSAVMLNHLYRRAPLPETTNVYKSRVPEAWINHRQLALPVNTVNGTELPPLSTF